VKLTANPVFLTQKRLVHRVGVLAAVLIAVLIGLSLLSGLIAYLSAPMSFGFRSPQEAGRVFYGWIIGVEILLLVIGGFSRISKVLAEERKAGLLDSNRLTPLKPAQIVIGYWFGPPLREVYMSTMLAAIGLVVVLLGRLPVTLWFGTQILIVSTALFLGLLAVLIGLVSQRPQNGAVVPAVLIVLLPLFSFIMPKYLLSNFLLPVYSIVNLFNARELADNSSIRDWSGSPEIFGAPIPPIVLSLGLQIIIGIFLWRAAVRKTAHPFQSPLFRWEATMLFGILVCTQHGLMWGVWRGHFPEVCNGAHNFADEAPMLSIVHCGTLLLAAVVLAFASPQPERVRVEALRTGVGNFSLAFSHSALPLALVLLAVAGMALFTQCAAAISSTWMIFAVAFGNLLDFFLVFVLLLEFCRLRFGRRALGFVGLWLFVLCVLPFILAGVFSEAAIGRLSLLSPGVLVLANSQGSNDYGSADPNFLLLTVLAQFGIAVLFFFVWRDQWQRLFAKADAIPPAK
jgi:hypothetical protein